MLFKKTPLLLPLHLGSGWVTEAHRTADTALSEQGGWLEWLLSFLSCILLFKGKAAPGLTKPYFQKRVQHSCFRGLIPYSLEKVFPLLPEEQR